MGFWHCAVLQEYSRWQDGTHRWNSNTYQVCWKVGADLCCLLVQAFQISADLIVIICMQHTRTQCHRKNMVLHLFYAACMKHDQNIVCVTMCSQSIRQRFLFSILGMQNQSKLGGTLWKSLLHLFSDAAMADFSGGCGYCHNDITIPRELWLVRVGHPETCENNYSPSFVLGDIIKALTVYVSLCTNISYQVLLLIDISRYLHVEVSRVWPQLQLPERKRREGVKLTEKKHCACSGW